MSTDNLHNGSEMDEQLRRSFDSWDTGEGPDMWESLSESLSVEKVWTDVSDSLEKEQFAIDGQLRTGYDTWNADSPKDLWNRLDESLSVEQVWNNLDQSLNRTTRPSGFGWLRIAAACILVLFFARNLNDETLGNTDSQTYRQNETSFNAGDNVITASVKDEQKNSLVINETDDQNNNNTGKITLAQGNRKQKQVSSDDQYKLNDAGNPGNADNDVVENDPPVIEGPADSTVTAEVDALPYERYNPELRLVSLDFPVMKTRYDHVLIQIGSQLASLRNNDPSGLSTSKTRIGLAADVAYRQRFGNLQFTGALGISQFTQEQGKYVNARYRNTQQKINMAQMSLCLGYNYRNVHFYGGPLLSNALTALEFNGSTITQIYNFRTIEPGLTAGIDYKLFDLRKRNNGLIIGAQYQYLPDNKLNSSNLNQIHGLRIQAKFSL